MRKPNIRPDGSNIIRHHSEQEPSLGEILSPTKVSILT
jgi:hypothetical protein